MNVSRKYRSNKGIFIYFNRLRYGVFGIMLLLTTNAYAQPKRIITLGSALTETVFALGKGANIVAVDVTSVSPEQAKALPKVSRNRSVSAEGLASYRPDLVLAPEGDLSRETIGQLRSLGIKVVPVKQEYSAKGSINFIKQVANAIGIPDQGTKLAQKTNADLTATLKQVNAGKQKKPKVLFIYARGTGTMSVAGKGSSLDAIITLSGGKNAIQEFSDFKPYTTEALIKANPDVILMFDFGLSSLGGKDDMLAMPGVGLTNAGKNKKIVTMDGPLLINFSSRLPQAIEELNKRLK
jgi:iron complex transport system substrate-binding protein